MSYDPKEYAEFKQMLVRQFATLTDISAKYTAKLLAHDRDWFFEQALEKAWEQRFALDPSRQRLGLWWDSICKEIAVSRPTWTVLTITGEKVVSGKHLHWWGLNCNGDFLDTI